MSRKWSADAKIMLLKKLEFYATMRTTKLALKEQGVELT